MNISNENDARDAVDAWRGEPPRAQFRNLQLAMESLELGQMYYEQKGNDQGVERLARCLVILQERKAELDSDLHI